MTVATERRLTLAAAFLTGSSLFMAVARGQEALAEPDPSVAADVAAHENVDVTAKALFEAVDHGDGWMIAALALSLLVMGLRFGGEKWLPEEGLVGRFRLWVISSEGGVVLTLAGALLAGMVSSISAGIPFGWAWVKASVKVAVASLGGFAGLKNTLGGKAKRERAERRETRSVSAAMTTGEFRALRAEDAAEASKTQ